GPSVPGTCPVRRRIQNGFAVTNFLSPAGIQPSRCHGDPVDAGRTVRPGTVVESLHGVGERADDVPTERAGPEYIVLHARHRHRNPEVLLAGANSDGE